MTAHLARTRTGSILAIDADPNSCFAGALGASGAQTIVGVCEELSGKMDRIPAGMTKERFIEMRVQDSIFEADRFDLISMGRPEGPGCYCYVNNLLRDLIGRITSAYDFIVIDNAAGMEHISRRTMGAINNLVLVSDYSVAGVRSTRRIFDLANEMKIKVGGAHLIINRVSGPLDALRDEIAKTGLAVAGEVPYSDELVQWNISGASVFEFNDAGIRERIAGIVAKVMG